MGSSYDVIVVGARVAGAATAMLLARHGLRVLLVDRGRYGSDVLSTHALMRGGVFLLSRWGLLDRVIAAGTPPIRQTRFDYGDEAVAVAIKPSPGVEALYAPRRTVLDRLLVDAAADAGTDVRFGVTVTGLLRNGDGRVVGASIRDRAGTTAAARAWLIVGADGIRSTVAREAAAATVRVGTAASAIIYGYWQSLPADGYEWFYRSDHSAGIIPTNSGEACVFAATAADRLTPAARADLHRTYHRLLAAATGGAGGRFADACAPRRLHTWVGRPSFVRHAHGAGWVLVGDAGYYLDPLSTHGITDALRDAELLTRSIVESGPAADVDSMLDRFCRTRDEIADRLFGVVEQIASHRWDSSQIQRYLRELSAAMNAEMGLMAATSSGGEA